jgi:hypothetical protein
MLEIHFYQYPRKTRFFTLIYPEIPRRGSSLVVFYLIYATMRFGNLKTANVEIDWWDFGMSSYFLDYFYANNLFTSKLIFCKSRVSHWLGSTSSNPIGNFQHLPLVWLMQ